MFWVFIYLMIGAVASFYTAGRFMEKPKGVCDDNAARIFFGVAGTLMWPFLIPAYFAFRAGNKKQP